MLDAAFAAGALERTRSLGAMLADLDASRSSRTRGRSSAASRAEAARFILRAISRELDNA